MQKLLFILFIFAALVSRSQPGRVVAQPNHFYLDMDLPVVIDKYPVFASGTPYFRDEWLAADIELGTGEIDKNIRVRIDFIDNTLQYISPQGRELIATTPIKTIILRDSTEGNVFKFISSSFLTNTKDTKAGWYLELVSGQACFYKKISKSMIQPKNYSASETQPSVNSSEEYFVCADSVLSPVKKIKDVPGLLKKMSGELDAYITANKLSGKSESGFIELIKYYNSLF